MLHGDFVYEVRIDGYYGRDILLDMGPDVNKKGCPLVILFNFRDSQLVLSCLMARMYLPQNLRINADSYEV